MMVGLGYSALYATSVPPAGGLRAPWFRVDWHTL